MLDKITLSSGDESIGQILGYTVDADIYNAAAAWRFDLDPTCILRAQRGDKVEMHVNQVRVLTGVLDKVTRGYTKSGRSLVIEGRDLLGVAVDSCCPKAHWKTLKNKKLSDVADSMLRDLPYLKNSRVMYGPAAFKAKTAEALIQVEPGQTYFDVLRNMAHSRGLVFFCLADGMVVIDRPKMGYAPAYRLVVKEDQNANGVLEASVIEDCSKQYSSVVVVGQRQDTGFSTASQVNVVATATDSTAPLQKTLVVVFNGDADSPAALARKIVELQQAGSRQLQYTVSGHTQNGKPWQINEQVYVWDEKLQVLGENLLIIGRSFELSRSRGAVTRLRLGPPGVAQ